MMDLASVLPTRFSYDLLKEITNDFSEERKIGSGGYGKVYKGVQKNGETIAVKLLYDMPGLDDEQFKKEFSNLMCLRHQNIVRLVGYCHDTRQECVEYKGKMVIADRIHRALCFEYAHNGSLHENLSDEYHGLDWRTRYGIIKGICNGLQYMHEELKPPMYHLDLKPANVLLDLNMVPKVGDFGLSRLFGQEQTNITKSSIGTSGYLPPEYIEQNILSKKFDIFSMGVVIIKVMAGPSGYSKCADMSSREFVKHVYINWRVRLQTPPICEPEPEAYYEQVKTCIEIALSCVEIDRHKRPNIREIVDKLNATETKIRLWSPLWLQVSEMECSAAKRELKPMTEKSASTLEEMNTTNDTDILLDRKHERRIKPESKSNGAGVNFEDNKFIDERAPAVSKIMEKVPSKETSLHDTNAKNSTKSEAKRIRWEQKKNAPTSSDFLDADNAARSSAAVKERKDDSQFKSSHSGKKPKAKSHGDVRDSLPNGSYGSKEQDILENGGGLGELQPKEKSWSKKDFDMPGASKREISSSAKHDRHSASEEQKMHVPPVSVSNVNAAPPLVSQIWVQCDICQRWRLLPCETDMTTLPKEWKCSMQLWLPGMNRCVVGEDVTTNMTTLPKEWICSMQLWLPGMNLELEIL